jgi:hypothetical protein
MLRLGPPLVLTPASSRASSVKQGQSAAGSGTGSGIRPSVW